MNKCQNCQKELKKNIGIFEKDVSLESGYPTKGVRFRTIPYCSNNPICKEKVTGKKSK